MSQRVVVFGLALVVIVGGCIYPPAQVGPRVEDFRRFVGTATELEVVTALGPPQRRRELEAGGYVLLYRVPRDEPDMAARACREYALTFDANRILRRWDSRACPDVRSAAPVPPSHPAFTDLTIEPLSSYP